MSTERLKELERALARARADVRQANNDVDRAESWLATLKETQKLLAMRYDSLQSAVDRETPESH